MSRPSNGGRSSQAIGAPGSVRGQLDPCDPKAPDGWRTIQLTETPGELKVLLPPGTAAMYEQLLKLEGYEITKKTSAPSERLLEIRHLKERMIRKCLHLAKPPEGAPKKAPTAFQTIVAEADFRMKSMEKFFRDEQKRLAVKAAASRWPDPLKQVPKQLAITNPPLVLRSATNPQVKEKAHSSSKPQASRPDRSLSMPAGSAGVVNQSTPRVTSPPPLPILLLSQREQYSLDLSPEPASEKPSPLLPFPVEAVELIEGIPSPGSPKGPSGKQLQKRPSCIKRRQSLGDLKRVSWADSQELDRQIVQYAAFIQTPQNPGSWDEVRSLYVDHIKGLERLHIQVQEGLEELQAESQHLQRIDETIRRQRDTLECVFREFEGNYTLFQEKVREVLTSATDSVTKFGPRAALPPIHEG